MNPSPRVRRAALLIAAAIALLVAGLGVFLLVVGVPGTSVQASVIGSPPNEPTTTYQPTPVGLVLVAAGVVVVLALAARARGFALGVAVALVAFSILTVFSIGPMIFPFAVALIPTVMLGLGPPTNGTPSEPV